MSDWRRGWMFVIVAVCVLVGIFAQNAAAEKVVPVPAGTYTLGDLVKESGADANWVRYKAEDPAKCIISGGMTDKQFVIIDGFTIGGQIKQGVKGSIIEVASSNVTFENCEIAGPHDFHLHYPIADGGKLNPGEPEHKGSNKQLQGITVKQGAKNVAFDKCVIHGFFTPGTFEAGSAVVIKDSIIRNNYNGFTCSGDTLVMEGSVLWDQRLSHLALEKAGTVRLHNNVLSLARQPLDAKVKGGVMCKEVELIHNTIYVPHKRPFHWGGVNVSQVTDKAVLRDNIIITDGNDWIVASPAIVQDKKLESDHNLFLKQRRSKLGFSIGTGEGAQTMDFDTWKAETGQDKNSVLVETPKEMKFVKAPKFVDDMYALPEVGNEENQWGYYVPKSIPEIRERLALAKDSPGKDAASDGKDMGITD